MEAINKIKTGIPGLDNLLKGGLPEQSTTILSGPPGIGKSNLGFQYIYEGAKTYNEPGIYMSVEYSKGEIKKYVSGFDWNVDELEQQDMLVIMEQRIGKQKKQKKETLVDVVERMGAKRLTMDSITLFNYMFEDEQTRRVEMLDFMYVLKRIGLTAILISEQYGIYPHMEVDPNQFLSDGLIQLFWTTQRERDERCVKVVKMRGQEIDTTIRPMEITKKGITVHHNQVPFTLAGD